MNLQKSGKPIFILLILFFGTATVYAHTDRILKNSSLRVGHGSEHPIVGAGNTQESIYHNGSEYGKPTYTTQRRIPIRKAQKIDIKRFSAD